MKVKMKSWLGLLSPTPVISQRAAFRISLLLRALSTIWDKPKGLKYFSNFSGVHWQADTCIWEKTSAKSVWQKMGPVNKTNAHTKKMGAISAASSAIVFSDKRDVSLLRWGGKASQLLGNSITDLVKCTIALSGNPELRDFSRRNYHNSFK